MDFSNEHKVVHQIFAPETGYRLQLARIQRHYEWTPEQATEMYESVCRHLVSDKDTVGEMEPLLLGDINLFNPSKGQQHEKITYFLYDGQQRPVSLCLLLMALRARMLELGDSQHWYVNRINKMMWIDADEMLSTPEAPRLLLKEEARGWFQHRLRSDQPLKQLLSLELSAEEKEIESVFHMWENLVQVYVPQMADLEEAECTKMLQYICSRVYFRTACISGPVCVTMCVSQPARSWLTRLSETRGDLAKTYPRRTCSRWSG